MKWNAKWLLLCENEQPKAFLLYCQNIFFQRLSFMSLSFFLRLLLIFIKTNRNTQKNTQKKVLHFHRPIYYISNDILLNKIIEHKMNVFQLNRIDIQSKHIYMHWLCLMLKVNLVCMICMKCICLMTFNSFVITLERFCFSEFQFKPHSIKP